MFSSPLNMRQFICAAVCGLYLVLSLCTCQTMWYKGNLHTHSLWSDGDDFPEMITDWYFRNNYDFMGLSDHNILQEGEKWVTVPAGSPKFTAYEKYLAKYGTSWVKTRETDNGKEVRLKTLTEYGPRFQQPGKFLIIKCEELTSGFERKPVHINATHVNTLITPQSGESVREVMQNNLDAILEIRNTTKQMIMPHINHPNFGWGIGVEDLIALRGERFFEVYNGHPFVFNEGDSAHMSTETMWDIINANYLADGKPLMYGLATDDSHHYHQAGPELSNSGRGWVMVNSKKLSAERLIMAMEQGHFYSSSGVILQRIHRTTKKLLLSIQAQPGVTYHTRFIGVRDKLSGPVVLAEDHSHQPSYLFKGDEWYVRATITSSKTKANPVLPDEKEKAWIQPVVVRGPVPKRG